MEYFKRINKLEAENNQVIKNFITNFTQTVKDLEKIHIKDRLQMSKNGGKALTDIAPELASIFEKLKADVSADRRDDHSNENTNAAEFTGYMESNFISRSNSTCNQIYYRQ